MNEVEIGIGIGIGIGVEIEIEIEIVILAEERAVFWIRRGRINMLDLVCFFCRTLHRGVLAF